MRSASLAVALLAAGGLLFVAACTEDSPVSPVVDQPPSVAPPDGALSPAPPAATEGLDGRPSPADRSFAEGLATREELALLGDGHCLVESRVPGGRIARRHGRVPQMRPEGADASHLRTLPVYTMDGRLLFRVTCRTLAGEEGVELMVARFVKLTIYRRSGALVSGTGSAPSAAVSGLGIEGAALVVGGDSATAVVVGGRTAASTSIDDPCDPDFDGVGLCVEVSRCDEENGEFYDAWDDECVCPTGWPCDDGNDDGPSGDDPPDDPDGGGGGGTGDSDNPDCDPELDNCDPCDPNDEICEPDCELDPLAEGCEPQPIPPEEFTLGDTLIHTPDCAEVGSSSNRVFQSWCNGSQPDSSQISVLESIRDQLNSHADAACRQLGATLGGFLANSRIRVFSTDDTPSGATGGSGFADGITLHENWFNYVDGETFDRSSGASVDLRYAVVHELYHSEFGEGTHTEASTADHSINPWDSKCS